MQLSITRRTITAGAIDQQSEGETERRISRVSHGALRLHIDARPPQLVVRIGVENTQTVDSLAGEGVVQAVDHSKGDQWACGGRLFWLGSDLVSERGRRMTCWLVA